jgi:hypothetical protein
VVESSRILREIASPQLNEFVDKLHLDAQDSPRFVCYAIVLELKVYSAKS